MPFVPVPLASEVGSILAAARDNGQRISPVQALRALARQRKPESAAQEIKMQDDTFMGGGKGVQEGPAVGFDEADEGPVKHDEDDGDDDNDMDEPGDGAEGMVLLADKAVDEDDAGNAERPMDTGRDAPVGGQRAKDQVVDNGQAEAAKAKPVRQDGGADSEKARSQRLAWLAVGGLGVMVAFSWRRRLARLMNSLLRRR